jgi:hypothetical protein
MSEHQRQVKRYTAHLRRHGACSVCIHGVQGEAGYHCRNAPEKSRGACMESAGGYPRFQVVEGVLDRFQDAR